MTKKLTLTFLFLFSVYKIDAHSRDDYNFYLTKCNTLSKNNLDSLAFYAKKLQTSDNQYLHLYGIFQDAQILYFRAQYDSSEVLLNHILKTIVDEPRPKSFFHLPNMGFTTYEEAIKQLKINIYRRFFYLKKNQDLLKEAYHYLLLRSKVVESLKEKNAYYLKNTIQVEKGMAMLKAFIGDYIESKEILFILNQKIQTIDILPTQFTKTQFLAEKANIQMEIAQVYLRLKDQVPMAIDSAEIFLDSAYTCILSYDTNKESVNKHLISYYRNKAIIANFKRDFKKGLKYSDRCIELLPNGQGEESFYYIKALCYSNLNEADSAIHYGKGYLKEFQQKSVSHYYGIYNALAKAYFSLSIYDSAYKYSELSLQGLLENRNQARLMNQELHQDTKTEYENLNQKILEKKNVAKNQLIIVSIVFLMSVGIFVFIIWKRKKQSNSNYEKLYQKYQELKETAERTSKKKTALKDQHKVSILEGLPKIEHSRLFMNKDFDLATLAKLLDSNTSYVSKTINEHIGKTFKEYLLELRMNALLNDLEQNPIIRKYSIDALAEYTGYSNPSAFSRAFKKHVHISPSQYLKETYINLQKKPVQG